MYSYTESAVVPVEGPDSAQGGIWRSRTAILCGKNERRRLDTHHRAGNARVEDKVWTQTCCLNLDVGKSRVGDSDDRGRSSRRALDELITVGFVPGEGAH